jgi:ABC-2 type transport system ATP-binding protein
MLAAALTRPSNEAIPVLATPVVASLRGVTKRFGSAVALDNFSLDLRPGEVLALLGPNGAGKTTAIRLLLGLTTPDDGAVGIFGRDPRDRHARTRMGVMLQISRVPETLKVREHIDLFRSYYPAPLAVEEITRRAHLEGIEGKAFGDLSGGQKQRLLFALAICGNPDLIFLDEPTVGLDIETRRRLWDEVQRLAAAGKTVLLTTHYLEEADALASRIVVIDKGRIVSQGTPAEIKSQVSGKKIRCITRLDVDWLRRLPGVAHVAADREAVILTTHHAEAVAREILFRDPSLTGLEITGAALEDAFLALTRSENPGATA